ncbi:crossover junction endodeoxyribonuclease RuvC [Anopheles sinensis]|uniref:Crossover junction endodeoxyribonuclease RuvC n=1 Tax=Anopheles sinensis TaxID=74873 RepID=A0A084WAI4_ANOSI|nr:crossover junction endodeoxyribonuclease RuvC [Anopheles sinensis]
MLPPSPPLPVTDLLQTMTSTVNPVRYTIITFYSDKSDCQQSSNVIDTRVYVCLAPNRPCLCQCRTLYEKEKVLHGIEMSTLLTIVEA